MRDRIERAGGCASALLSRRISLARTPVFAAMALATGLGGGEMADMPGMASSPLNGMALMYLLMAVFHAGPWLGLIAAPRNAHILSKETEA